MEVLDIGRKGGRTLFAPAIFGYPFFALNFFRPRLFSVDIISWTPTPTKPKEEEEEMCETAASAARLWFRTIFIALRLLGCRRLSKIQWRKDGAEKRERQNGGGEIRAR